MRNLLLLGVALFSVQAFASMDPVPGSCSKPASDGWSRCQFVSSLDGRVSSGQIHSSVLSCYHFTGWENNPACVAANPDRCVFSNVQYAGKCVEVVRDTLIPADVEKRCEEILSCLNDSRCVGVYCTATTIRGGWQLDDVISGYRR